MKIALVTVGCKLNQYETSAMSEMLKENGFEIVPFISNADFYIINSCSVTKKAELDTRKFIKSSKHINPDSKIIVTGCCAKFIDPDSVSLVLDNKQKTRIVDHICKLSPARITMSRSGKNLSFSQNLPLNSSLSEGDSSSSIYEKSTTAFFPLLKTFYGHSRAFIKIQDGCSVSCSYCIVPLVRGGSRSQSRDEIIEQAKIFIGRGYKEMVISGVNVGAYGRDLTPKINLANLLKEIISIPKLGRIRLSSIEPQEFDRELIDVITDPKICPHLHLPLQSGDDKTLEAMGRKYRLKDYLQLTDTLFKKIPNLNLGTDVIVGFPGEGDEEFDNTYEFIKSIPFAYLHIFRYSQRPNTKAVLLKDQVPEKIKKERALKLALLNKQKKDSYAEKYLNKSLPVFIEKQRDKKTKKWVGLSDNYLRIYVNGPEEIKSQIVMVKITELGDRILGEVICH